MKLKSETGDLCKWGGGGSWYLADFGRGSSHFLPEISAHSARLAISALVRHAPTLVASGNIVGWNQFLVNVVN